MTTRLFGSYIGLIRLGLRLRPYERRLPSARTLVSFQRHSSNSRNTSTPSEPATTHQRFSILPHIDNVRRPSRCLRYQNSARHLSDQRKTSIRAELTEIGTRFEMEWPKITLFGDSITRYAFDVEAGCWGSMVAFKVGNYFDVDCRGFPGYNTRWALELAPELFPRSYLDKVDTLVMFFGHNDSWQEGCPMHVPLAEYEQNLHKLIKLLVDNGLERRKIILITPGWYCKRDFEAFLGTQKLPPISKEFEMAEKFCNAVLRVGREESIEVVDFFAVSKDYKPLGDLFCDGLHLSCKGAKVLFELLMPVIERKIQEKYKKPLADLWHAIPLEQRPELQEFLRARKPEDAGEE